jgi:hypothetical protein
VREKEIGPGKKREERDREKLGRYFGQIFKFGEW